MEQKVIPCYDCGHPQSSHNGPKGHCTQCTCPVFIKPAYYVFEEEPAGEDDDEDDDEEDDD